MSQIKRLFQITLANGKPWHQKGNTKVPGYFTNKRAAKTVRDEVNNSKDFPNNLKPAVVQIGPDHWRKE